MFETPTRCHRYDNIILDSYESAIFSYNYSFSLLLPSIYLSMSFNKLWSYNGRITASKHFPIFCHTCTHCLSPISYMGGITNNSSYRGYSHLLLSHLRGLQSPVAGCYHFLAPNCILRQLDLSIF